MVLDMVLLAFIAYHYEYVGTDEESKNDDIVDEVSKSISSTTTHTYSTKSCSDRDQQLALNFDFTLASYNCSNNKLQ